MTNDGLKEEILVSNLFSKLGYFTRVHIIIYPEDGEKRQLSDIDVFTLKFDNLLLPTKNIIETKRSSDKSSALFQLYGFKKYFDDCNVFFVNQRPSHKNVNVANKLNIKAYSFNRLKNMTKKEQTFTSVDIKYEDGQKLITYLDKMKKINNALYWDYHALWVEKNPYRKLSDIQEIFEVTEDIYDSFSHEEAFQWFRRELFIMAFISVIEIASKCISIDNYIINNYIQNQFYNLGTSKQRKIEIKSAVDSLLDIIKEKTDLDLDNLTLDLIPPWTDSLTKIVKIMIKNAKYANAYLLANENVHKSYIIEKPQNISIFAYNELETKIISAINTELLKILHKEHIKTDFNHFLF